MVNIRFTGCAGVARTAHNVYQSKLERQTRFSFVQFVADVRQGRTYDYAFSDSNEVNFSCILASTGRISRWILNQRRNVSVLTYSYAFRHLWNCLLSPLVIIIVSDERGLICDRIAPLQWLFLFVFNSSDTFVRWWSVGKLSCGVG